MTKFYRILLFFIGLFVITASGDFLTVAVESVRPEIRAIWVDAFHDGAKTPAQIDKLIQDCLSANMNTLIVQIRRRGDAYYNNSIEPRTEDPVLPNEFDALQYLIDKAHMNHLEVHAWLNTLVAWNSSIPPTNPNHVWNLHGPMASGRANWVSYYRIYDNKLMRWPDKLYTSYYLDPGNPDALDYTVDIYLQVVKNYDIDGIHLDYSRYEGLDWGYNPMNVDRYNACFGTTGMPAPDEPGWSEWRREQTANLVRKIYLKAIAMKPNLKVSSAVITWGDGPVTDDDWEKSAAYNRVAQDWRGWLKEGIIDFVIPMNYFSEWNPTQQNWYDKWIEWEKNHQYGRYIVVGPGIFLQYIDQSLEQIRRAQAPSALGNYSAGVALFAYGWSNLYSNDDYKKQTSYKSLPRQPHRYMPETNDWFFPLLSKPGDYFDPVLNKRISTEPVFPTPAPLPDFSWKSHPVNGYLMGTVLGHPEKKYDHIRIIAESFNTNGLIAVKETYTDGNGWYGFAELPPGYYKVSLDLNDFSGSKFLTVSVNPGQVSEANF